MRAPFSRLLLAFTVASFLVFSLAGIASANVLSKTITVTNGDCVISGNPPTLSDGVTACGAAVYDPVDGFTGTITFASGEGDILISDFLCENVKGTGGGFTSVGGSYTLTLSYSGSTVGGATYTIAGGTTCSGTNTQSSFPVALNVPAGSGTYVVEYSLVLDGFDPANFTGDNSILNRVEEQNDGHANSPSVAPPQGNPPVPEAPFTVLLIGTGALTAVWFVSRKLRNGESLTAA